MNLYLITYTLDVTPYMGSTRAGTRDYHIVWADDACDAKEKLEAELAPPGTPGSDSYWLHIHKVKAAIGK